MSIISPEIKIAALELVNESLQRLIDQAEGAGSRDLALEIASIKYQVNQNFDKTRRNETATSVPILRLGLPVIIESPKDDTGS